MLPVKEWESHLRLDLPITQITPLPAENSSDPTFDGALPKLSEEEIKQIIGWKEKDARYVKEVAESKRSGGVRERMVNWAKGVDSKTGWWEVRKGERYRPPMGEGNGRLRIVWPQDKVQIRAKTSHRGRKEIRLCVAAWLTSSSKECQESIELTERSAQLPRSA